MTKNEETTKTPGKRPKTATAAKSAGASKKPVKAKSEISEAHLDEAPVIVQETAQVIVPTIKPEIAKGRYVFATGRRKSAVANIRLYSGDGEMMVNKKPFDTYFFHKMYRDEATHPLRATGLLADFYFTVNVSGSGIKAQSQAVRHALSRAIASLDPELRKQMRKAGFLTRDYREKERKKPGLKRARRSPQWAKR
jgi:small subunit ribosomal protein S9